MVIAIAAAFLVYNLGILRFDVSCLWPVALIAIGAAIRVPPDWAVDVRSSAAFGSIESKRAEPSDPRARLTVTGSCLFGGILIVS